MSYLAGIRITPGLLHSLTCPGVLYAHPAEGARLICKLQADLMPELQACCMQCTLLLRTLATASVHSASVVSSAAISAAQALNILKLQVNHS